MSHKKRNYHSENNFNPHKIQNYVEDITDWRRYPGKIINGEMEVLFHGHWVYEKEFLGAFPMPNPSTFRKKRENIDSTQNWK